MLVISFPRPNFRKKSKRIEYYAWLKHAPRGDSFGMQVKERLLCEVDIPPPRLEMYQPIYMQPRVAEPSMHDDIPMACLTLTETFINARTHSTNFK